MSFYIKYALTAVILSAAVYIGAPMLGKKTSDAAIDDLAENMADTSYSNTPEPADVRSSAVTTVNRTKTRGVIKVLPSRKAQPPRQQPEPQQGEQEVVVENVISYTPSTDRIPSSGPDVQFWGVAINDAQVYERDGRNRDSKIPGGTLVEVTKTSNSSRGEVALCRIRHNNNWVGPYLIATTELIRFEGGREEVDANDVEKLCAYYALNAKMQNRENELKLKVASANPHFAELKRKADQYNAHKKRAEELTAKRDSAKGPERSKIISELTQLKNTEAREASDVAALTKKYEDWKKSHPNAATANVESDAVYMECKRRMEAMLPELAVFGL